MARTNTTLVHDVVSSLQSLSLQRLHVLAKHTACTVSGCLAFTCLPWPTIESCSVEDIDQPNQQRADEAKRSKHKEVHVQHRKLPPMQGCLASVEVPLASCASPSYRQMTAVLQNIARGACSNPALFNGQVLASRYDSVTRACRAHVQSSVQVPQLQSMQKTVLSWRSAL